MSKEEIIKKEYDRIIEVWKFEHKWLDKMPFKDADYTNMIAECNDAVKKKPKNEQAFLTFLLNGYIDHMAEIDRTLKEKGGREK